MLLSADSDSQTFYPALLHSLFSLTSPTLQSHCRNLFLTELNMIQERLFPLKFKVLLDGIPAVSLNAEFLNLTFLLANLSLHFHESNIRRLVWLSTWDLHKF